MNIDINFLLDKPEFTKTAILKINPLAPLSMVTNVPGSYYKTEHQPDKYMLCGLFENLLNFHLTIQDRTIIRRKIKNYYQREKIGNYLTESSNVGFQPIINHLFEIELPIVKPQMIFYEDYWTQHLIGADERHFKGCINNSWEIENDIIKLNKENNNKKISKYFKENISKFPMYYRSPKLREFMIAKGEYLIKLKMTENLFLLIKNILTKNNNGYLGTSEGWVDLEIGELI